MGKALVASAALVMLLAAPSQAQAASPQSFTLKCYGMPGKPAFCLDESDIAALPKCSAATVKMWQAPGPRDMDQRVAALPTRKCVMSTETGKYLCQRGEGCGRYHPQVYRATKEAE